MSEELNTPPVEPTPTEPASGLPSDNIQPDLTGFELNDELKGKFKDGKLNGRFSSIDEVLTKLKEAEDFKANTIREQTEAEKAKAAQQTDAQKAEAQAAVQQDTIMDMLPTFIENGMELTPEMEQKATEVGIDIRDLKLGALELKERTQKAHSIVGGADEYNAMLEWGKTSMTDAQKAAFDKDIVNGSVSEYVIKGLHADFVKAKSAGETPQRLEGSTVVNGIKPYATKKELYADKDYVESAAGRRDHQAQKNYRARLNATPDSVLFGR